MVQAHVDEALLVEQDGRRAVVDMSWLDPIICAPDKRRYRIGKPIGVRHSEGRKSQNPTEWG